MIDRHLFYNFDWILVINLFLIISLGLATIYSASNSLGLGNYYFYRQLIWVGLGTVLMLIVAFADYRFFAFIGVWFHLFVILLLALTLLYGTGSSASKVERWLRVGPFFIQASEFAKYSILLTIAYFLKDSKQFSNISFGRLLFLAILILIPFVMILQQPDLGTALMYLAIALIMIFFAGIKYKIVFSGLLTTIIFAPLAWEYALADYQKLRILTILDPAVDKQGSGYHITQSIIAIGSGGIFGKGFLHGSQAQLNFLPARHTDFIFALFAEERGFIGSIVLIALYSFLIIRIISPVGKMKYALRNLIVIGVATVISLHILINIAMVTRLLPVVGIPLPFFSYGGSAMLNMFFGIGLVLSIRGRKFEDY